MRHGFTYIMICTIQYELKRQVSHNPKPHTSQLQDLSPMQTGSNCKNTIDYWTHALLQQLPFSRHHTQESPVTPLPNLLLRLLEVFALFLQRSGLEQDGRWYVEGTPK